MELLPAKRSGLTLTQKLLGYVILEHYETGLLTGIASNGLSVVPAMGTHLYIPD